MARLATARRIEPVYEAVWEAIPESSQERVLSCPAHHVLYTGTRGPGKTDVQLMDFRQYVGMGYGPFWRGVIFDREYKPLDDIISKSKRWFPRFNDSARFLSSKSDYKWVWPTGEELLFRSVKTLDDYWDFHGQEFPYIGWNELCKHPTLELYDRLMSCNRSSFTPQKDTPAGRLVDVQGRVIFDRSEGILLPPIPLRVNATTNPFGSGHNAVKRRFITPAPYGVPVKRTVLIFDPKTKEDIEVTKYQVAIFGSWRENIYLSPEYIAELKMLSDRNLKKAWDDGDWDIVAGGALDDVWNKSVHILPSQPIPKGWHIDRALDWGSTHPFAVGWFAEANGEGELVRSDGSRFCPPPGTLVQFAEWYGSKELGTNKGLKMSGPDIAVGILEIEKYLVESKLCAETPWPGPADNQIRDVRESDVDTIEKKMADKGVRWTDSDKSQGSRKIGLQLCRDRLEASTRREGQGIYFTDNCRASIDLLPSLPRDEKKLDDVDTTSEDHVWDMVRYRVLRGSNRFARAIKVTWTT